MRCAIALPARGSPDARALQHRVMSGRNHLGATTRTTPPRHGTQHLAAVRGEVLLCVRERWLWLRSGRDLLESAHYEIVSAVHQSRAEPDVEARRRTRRLRHHEHHHPRTQTSLAKHGSSQPTQASLDDLPEIDVTKARILGRGLRKDRKLPLRALREGAGKTQGEVASLPGMDQSEISRVEQRDDLRLSTLRRYARARCRDRDRGGVADRSSNQAGPVSHEHPDLGARR